MNHYQKIASFKPDASDVVFFTDKYFTNTRKIVENFGDIEVTYAVFMRRPVICAATIALDWLTNAAKERGINIKIERKYNDGDWVGAGEPMLYFTGSFAGLSEFETIFLQKIGATSVAAYNAFSMCIELKNANFIAMDARHCAGTEMADLMAYAAKIGSDAAKLKGAKGFIGSANDATAHYFNQPAGLGTMPHSLIGYAGSTLRAAEMFNKTFPEKDLVVLVDYFGAEITDALSVCKNFPIIAESGRLSVRIDTHGGRFIEGLDTPKSYEVLERNAPDSIRGYRSEKELKHLIGTGVSAAAIWHMRENLDNNGFKKVKIVASSGFSTDKCSVMAYAQAPIDVVGTGSYLPENWIETYATADVIAYNNENRVKIGREFLIGKKTK